MRIETLAVHAGHAIDPATGAVAAPIHLSTTFERDAEGGYPHGYSLRRAARIRPAMRSSKALAALEGGEDAAAFGSGLAASSAILQALAPGDHVIAPTDVYHGMTKLLRDVFMRWGLEVSFVDMTNIDEIKQAVRPKTKLIWMETPSNPQLKITDIARVAEIAHAAGAICVCDNTWAPIVQRPLDLGADLVMHSTTKYLGGHSDVTGGVVIAKAKTRFFRARARDPNHGRRGPLAFRLLADPARHALTPVADARAFGKRAQGRDLARQSSARGNGALSGTRFTSGPRDRGAADERV